MTAPARARILGLGTYLPPRIVSNHDLTQFMDTSHEWIVERSGVEERRWVDAGEIDCITYATLSPDYFFPGCGVLVQRALGIGHVTAFDIRQQCSGFVYGLLMADAFIRSGQ